MPAPNEKLLHKKIYYIHLRYENPDHAIANTGGITIAFHKEDSKLFVAYARCHWNDNYNKRIGRNIASGRLLSGDCYALNLDSEDNVFTDVVTFVNAMVAKDHTKAHSFYND